MIARLSPGRGLLPIVVSAVALGLLEFTGIGCSTCPVTRLNISVAVDESIRKANAGRPVIVDVVGVNEPMQSRMENYSMTKYWQPDDPERRNINKRTLTFDPSGTQAQIISVNDPIWNQWLAGSSDKHPTRIFVLALLPGVFQVATDYQPGNRDPRRISLPTGACRWENNGFSRPPMVKLVVTAGRLMLVSPPPHEP